MQPFVPHQQDLTVPIEAPGKSQAVTLESVSKLLFAPDTETRELCAKAIAANGMGASFEQALPFLSNAFIRDAQVEVRANLALAFGQARGYERDVVPLLVLGATDSAESVQIAALHSLALLGSKASAALPALLCVRESDAATEGCKHALNAAIAAITPANWSRSVLGDLPEYIKLSPENLTKLRSLNSLSHNAQTPDDAFETRLKSCYIKSNSRLDVGADIFDLSRHGLILLLELADTQERKDQAVAACMFMRGTVTDDVSAIAIQGLVSLGYLPHAVAALGLSQACSPKFGNIVRERILDSIAELCSRAKDPSLNAIVAEGVREWLVPKQEERRITLDDIETESAASLSRELIDEIRAFRGELVLPRSDESLSPHDKHVRARAINLLSSITKPNQPQTTKTIESLVTLAEDPEPTVRTSSLIALGRLAEFIGEEVIAVAKIVVKERQFTPKCAGVWCLQRAIEIIGDGHEARDARAASFTALGHVRTSLQKNEALAASGLLDPVLLHVLAQQQQLSLLAPSSAEVNTLIHKNMHNLHLPEAVVPVSIGALGMLPFIPDNPEFPRQRVLELVAGSDSIHNHSDADIELERSDTRALPEAEVPLCHLLGRTDSKRAVGLAFQALKVASNRFAVTLQAKFRPEHEQVPFLETVARAALDENAWRMVELLDSGQKYFKSDDSHFAKLWKTTLLKSIDVGLKTMERAPDREARALLRNAVEVYTNDSDLKVRHAAENTLGELSSPLVYSYLKLKHLFLRGADFDRPLGAATGSEAQHVVFESRSSNRPLRLRELKALSTLERGADPLKEVRVEAARILLHDIPESAERNASIEHVYVATNSIAVRGMLARRAALAAFVSAI